MTATEYQSAFEHGRETKVLEHDINGVTHIQVPKDCTLESMEKLMDAPIRIREHPSFTDIEGFSEYIKEFKIEGSRIFVDDSNHRFSTVFDCHHKGKPAWGDHSASMTLQLSNEWQRFVSYDGKKMSPKDFAELLEDNVQYLSTTDDTLSGADLLTMAQTFKVSVKGEIDVEESLQSGLKHMVIRDDSTLKGKDSAGQEISFPEKLKFDLRIFKNHAAFPIEVYLRHRTSKDAVMFFIKIPDPDGIKEEAFDKVIEKVKTETELPTLKGSFTGPDHRR